MLPKLAEGIVARRREVQRSAQLQALAARLERFVDPLLTDDVYFPRHKALLSRDGGICEVDGSRLLFDPLNPDCHVCPRCRREHFGKRHHRAWVWRYHLWLSERAVHLALLGELDQNPSLSKRALVILEGYAVRYRQYPNSDNVLGPTRLFFSTYLESIWLAQLTMAAQLLRSGATISVSPSRGFDKMVKESAGLISSFDEGWSNRQVWNNVALIAAGLWLGGPGQRGKFHRFLIHGLEGPHGIRPQLVSSVTEEGMWFEGENYHFFALRGCLLAAELLRLVGIDIYGGDGPRERLHDMFLSPLRTVLPDLTLPARGDSPFGVSLLQPRFAELWEIGWVRTGDKRLRSLLSDLYSADVEDGDDPGLHEIAEQEQNRPAQLLRRELLGWKALWLMDPEEPATEAGTWRVGSTLLPQAGVAVLRPDRNRYVSVECGGQAGGHGHPDLLHLTLFESTPLLMDFGTASYVSPSLHWYRSTLAHNAPGPSGEDQRGRKAWCAAIDQRAPWGWCRVVAENLLGLGTIVTRTLVVGPKTVLDVVDVECPDGIMVDLPVHLLDPDRMSLDDLSRTVGGIPGTDERLGEILELESTHDLVLKGKLHTVILHRRDAEHLLVSERPGPPDDQFADGRQTAFLIRRASGAGRWVQCYGLTGEMPVAVRFEREVAFLDYGDGNFEKIAVREDKCRIVDRVGKTHKLGGFRLRPEEQYQPKRKPRAVWCPILESRPSALDWEAAVPKAAVIELGAAHYRRSETPYGAARPFAARVAAFVVGSELCFAARVVKRDVSFRTADAEDPALDNEPADIHSDGIQVYVGGGAGGRWRGYLLVPDPVSESVRVAPVAGTGSDESKVEATWARTGEGYNILAAVNLGAVAQRGQKIPVNLVVNEMYSGRERRAGQLALSGGGWVYLRGDREFPGSAIVAEVF